MTQEATDLATWLTETCEKERLSLREAAAKTGLSHGTIRDLKNGVCPSTGSIKKLAEGFSEDIHERLSLEDHLLILAGHRTPRPGQELSRHLARLIDRLSYFDEAQLQMMVRFAEYLTGTDKERR